MHNYKITCPYCGESFIMYECFQSMEDFENENIKGRCLNCHKIFLMKDAVATQDNE